MARPELLGVVIGLLVAGCNGPEGRSLAPVPTHETSEGGPTELAELVGVLRVERGEDLVCAWVEADSGARILVVWPRGFQARVVDDQLAIANGSGDTRAVEGEVVTLGGGFRTDARAADCETDGQEAFHAGGVQ